MVYDVLYSSLDVREKEKRNRTPDSKYVFEDKASDCLNDGSVKSMFIHSHNGAIVCYPSILVCSVHKSTYIKEITSAICIFHL
jgi:hypothetical protein